MGALSIGRVVLRREVIAVIVLFVVGIAAGLVVGQALAGEKRGAPTDYAVLVARLFERDGNQTLAIARLKQAGVENPAEAVATIAAQHSTSTTENARDAESLRKLAVALGGSTAAQSGGGIPTTYLLTALVALVTLGLAALLAIRILGVRLPNLRRPAALRGPAQPIAARQRAYAGAASRSADSAWSPPDSAPETAGEPAGPRRQGAFLAGSSPNGNLAPAAPPAFSNGTSLRTRPMTPSDPSRPSANGSATHQSIKPRPARSGQLRAVPPSRGYCFRSTYRLGDEPYDEIHPISDDGGHTLVGACGVSGSRFLADTGQKRYWGFTAWLHDYAVDGQFRAVGLVSRWAFDHFSDEIDEWRSLGDIDEIRLIGFDTAIELRTVNLTATLSIEDIDYLHGAPPDAFVNRLAAQFDVQLHQTSPAKPSSDEGLAAEG